MTLGTSVLHLFLTDSEIRSDQFNKEQPNDVINQINSNLNGLVTNFDNFRSSLWSTIDQEIDIKECAIYSFTPDLNSNPFEEEGLLHLELSVIFLRECLVL